MRAGLSTIQQTLTPDAASVLNQSISEAGRRNHGQTTPLHVAATLLASPSGFLRQACIRSHPNSSHPLQCRALELCFSVALERLPTAQNTVAPASEPPISNALMAALKRAQAHQRRGCPEQQQQPLLAVKVELEQLIISILDDPSVSRVMREASFSSPAVKATIEQSLNNSNVQTHHPHQVPGGNLSFGSSFGGIGPRFHSNSNPLTPATPPPPAEAAAPLAPLVNRNMYLNPRLQTGARGLTENQKSEEVKKVLEIMGRSKKRNPILVGDSEPEAVVKELLRRIENKELGSDWNLKNLQVLPLQKGLLSDKNQVSTKIEELRGLIESKIRAGGVILDLGELKWLVEQPASLGGAVAQQPKQAAVVSDAGRAAVVEITKLLASFCKEDGSHDSGNKLWLIGTATCETFLRCQVYHSTMETDWDLQAVPIASRSPAPGMFPRLGAERLLNRTAVDSLNSLKTFLVRMPAVTKPASENMNPGRRSTFCPQCSENYEKELDKLAAIQKSFSEAKQETRPSLPQWLQSAKLDSKTTDESQSKDHELVSHQKKHELQKKWRDTCLHLHPKFHQNVLTDKTGPPAVSAMGLYNSNVLSRPSLTVHPASPVLLNKNGPLEALDSPAFQPRLQMNKPLGEALQLNMNQVTMDNNPPGSHVRTDLFLGSNVPDNANDESSADQAKDFLGCISSEPQATKLLDKFAHASDADTYKKLLKGLMERAWWQAEAAAAVASAVTRFRLEDGKRLGAGSRGDIWLLFTGPDRVGKKKMASVVSEQICGATPIMICLGIRRDHEESDNSFRGKTAVDRIAEGVRRNPCSVIMLEDIDEADMLVRGSIKRAIERGRLIDSHGREVGLGNAIFIVTGDWSTTDPEALRGHFVDQNKLASVASGCWQLGLIVRDKSAKRRANWLQDEDRSPLKTRRETSGGLSLDLNLSAASYGEDDKTDGSDLTTIDHDDDEPCPANGHFSITSVPHELASNVDESIVFRPIESSFVRREIKKTISMRFSMVVDENLSIEIGDDVLDKILGGLCHDRTSLKEWVERVVDPSFEQLKSGLPSGCDRSGAVVRLVVESDSCHRGKSKGNVDWLPSSILV